MTKRSYRVIEPDAFIDFGSKKYKEFAEEVDCDVFHVSTGVTMKVLYSAYTGDNSFARAHSYVFNLHGRLGDIRRTRSMLEKKFSILLDDKGRTNQ